ncbi:hypothetical protein F4778DRAFT_747348 [Xylariomycetidae sp. FL2044]|nr:hypothetical protein F4778DRAFT_747348 [Xylariomycetidae sp. FL2044]
MTFISSSKPQRALTDPVQHNQDGEFASGSIRQQGEMPTSGLPGRPPKPSINTAVSPPVPKPTVPSPMLGHTAETSTMRSERPEDSNTFVPSRILFISCSDPVSTQRESKLLTDNYGQNAKPCSRGICGVSEPSSTSDVLRQYNAPVAPMASTHKNDVEIIDLTDDDDEKEDQTSSGPINIEKATSDLGYRVIEDHQTKSPSPPDQDLSVPDVRPPLQGSKKRQRTQQLGREMKRTRVQYGTYPIGDITNPRRGPDGMLRVLAHWKPTEISIQDLDSQDVQETVIKLCGIKVWTKQSKLLKGKQ